MQGHLEGLGHIRLGIALILLSQSPLALNIKVTLNKGS
jgi:hypothetical protein